MRPALQPSQPPRLPARDAWLLPLVSLATVLVMLIGAEVASRAVWPEQVDNACRMPDPVIGYRYRPNCTALTKAAEGPWVTNSYNACGYRSAAPCGAVAPGTRRVALIGSSLSEGYLVPYDDTVGAQLTRDLSRSCGATVEVQNLGGVGYSGHLLTARMAEALRLRPDAVLLLLAPFDLEGEMGAVAPPPSGNAAAQPAGDAADGPMHRIFTAFKRSRAVLVTQHFLFRNAAIYLPLYLRYGDKADFLRPPFSPNWQARLRAYDTLLAGLGAQAHQAGVPLSVGFVPQEAQVALMAGRPLPPGIDPDALPRALQAIAARHGVGFIDTSAALRLQATPERLFYQVDGHLSGSGQPIIASYIAEQMVSDPHGAFAGCNALASLHAASKG